MARAWGLFVLIRPSVLIMRFLVDTVLPAFAGKAGFDHLVTPLARRLPLARRQQLGRRGFRPRGRVSVPVAGATPLELWADGDEWVANFVFFDGTDAYEPDTLPVFLALAERGRTVLDIGAHVGTYALLAARSNPSATVVAFEPVQATCDRLTRNVLLNKLGNIICVRAAVGETRAELPVFSGLGSIHTSSSHDLAHARRARPSPEREALRCEIVPVVSVDDFIETAHLEGVDLVKIDVETAEASVIRGMTATLSRYHPDVICEVLPARWSGTVGRQLEDALGPMGYQFYVLGDDELVRHDHIEGREGHWNQLFSVRPAGDLQKLLGRPVS